MAKDDEVYANHNKLKLCIALPFGGRYVAPEWALSVACLTYPMNVNYMFTSVKKMARDKARNLLVEQAKEAGAEFILFLDDDTAPPNFTVSKLMYELEIRDDDYAVCAGIYTTKTANPEPMVFMGPGEGPHWKWKLNDVIECWGVGAGCMMIRMSVFDKIKKPYFVDIKTKEQAKKYPDVFKSIKRLDPLKVEITDDLFFCTKLANAGFKVLAHGGVLPLHWNQDGEYFCLPDDSYPVKAANMKRKEVGIGVTPRRGNNKKVVSRST